MSKKLDEPKKINKILLFFIYSFFLIVGTVFYSRYIGTSRILVREIKITDESLPDEYHGLKIVHFGDLHYGSTIYLNEVKELVFKINEVKPDIVVFTGDLFDTTYLNGLSKTERENVINSIVDEFNRIDVGIDKYAISGNHDKEFTEWEMFLENCNFINLDDNYDLIYSNSNSPILLMGISSNMNSTVDVTDKFSSITDAFDTANVYSILMLHEPDYVDKIDYGRFKLILSGHSHNGQVRIPYVGAIYTPEGSKKYKNEYYDLNGTNLYVTGGIGTTKYNFRLFTRPSFNLYRLTNK